MQKPYGMGVTLTAILALAISAMWHLFGYRTRRAAVGRACVKTHSSPKLNQLIDLTTLGFNGTTPAITGRPSYHPGVMLKIYIYGYLNRVPFYEQNIVKVIFGLTCESATCSSCTSQGRGDATAVESTGPKPIVALVRPSVSPPSIRWRLASLILHAHCAGIFREHAPSQESVTSVTRVPDGHVHFKPSLHRVSCLPKVTLLRPP